MSSSNKLKVYCQNCNSKLDLTGHKPFSQVQCPQCSKPVVVPMRFGHFLLEEILAESQVFSSYRALDLTLNRQVCLRVIRSSVVGNKDLLKKILKQAGRISMVSDDRIVPLFSSGEINDRHYLVFQYLGGGSIRQHLEKSNGLLPLRTVYRIIREAALSLQAGVSQGLIHGGLSLNDIVLDSDGAIKVGDFGFKRLAFEAGAMKADKLFSCEYLSPSVLTSGTFTNAANIYSLGALFYHLATGILPFPAAMTAEAVSETATQTPREPKVLRRELSQETSDFIMTLMSKTSTRAPESFGEIADFCSLQMSSNTSSPQPALEANPPQPQIVLEPSGSSTGGAIKYIICGLVALLVGGASVFFLPQLKNLGEKITEKIAMTEEVVEEKEPISSDQDELKALLSAIEADKEPSDIVVPETVGFDFEKPSYLSGNDFSLLNSLPTEINLIAPLVKLPFVWSFSDGSEKEMTLTGAEKAYALFDGEKISWNNINARSLSGYLVELQKEFDGKSYAETEVRARLARLIASIQNCYDLPEKKNWQLEAKKLNPYLKN